MKKRNIKKNICSWTTTSIPKQKFILIMLILVIRSIMDFNFQILDSLSQQLTISIIYSRFPIINDSFFFCLNINPPNNFPTILFAMYFFTF
jgi:hypothetical protein